MVAFGFAGMQRHLILGRLLDGILLIADCCMVMVHLRPGHLVVVLDGHAHVRLGPTRLQTNLSEAVAHGRSPRASACVIKD